MLLLKLVLYPLFHFTRRIIFRRPNLSRTFHTSRVSEDASVRLGLRLGNFFKPLSLHSEVSPWVCSLWFAIAAQYRTCSPECFPRTSISNAKPARSSESEFPLQGPMCGAPAGKVVGPNHRPLSGSKCSLTKPQGGMFLSLLVLEAGNWFLSILSPSSSVSIFLLLAADFFI